ncbi:hypothetical protein [Pediococcus pentosaceus]|uniref:hypothetical protein n=1 Tax=Pediococcus pentosaceus TaxID=1255 RepID=UPI0021E97429|nr:hypothetical protein [Pediococcus pentosaceus]MCV3318982.1 hypothetical protein [Pediococcus pentosaceus]
MKLSEFVALPSDEQLDFVTERLEDNALDGNEHFVAIIRFLENIEYDEPSEDSADYAITAKLRCEDESFSKTMDQAKEKTDELAASAKMANEELDRFQAKLSELGLVVDKGKLVFKCSVQSDD